MDLNKVIVTGRLVRDPQCRRTTSDVVVCTLTLAVNGLKPENTVYLDVVNWNNESEHLAKYLRKGLRVAVVGRLNQRSYERKDGTKVQVLEVYAEQVNFLDPKAEQPAEEVKEESKAKKSTKKTTKKSSKKIDETDDDLPF